jgi:hypothetical protein
LQGHWRKWIGKQFMSIKQSSSKYDSYNKPRTRTMT